MKSKSINVSQHLSIPVDPKHSLFFITDYLRILHDPKRRKQVISDFGGSIESIHAFERDNRLPHGAFQVAIMAEDEKVRELSARMNAQLTAGPITKEVLNKVMMESATLNVGLSRIYPDAVSFLNRFTRDLQRIRERGTGDFDVKPIFAYEVAISVEAGSAVNVEVGVNLNAFINANVHIFLNVVSVAVLVAAVFLFIAIPIWLYGPNFWAQRLGF